MRINFRIDYHVDLSNWNERKIPVQIIAFLDYLFVVCARRQNNDVVLSSPYPLIPFYPVCMYFELWSSQLPVCISATQGGELVYLVPYKSPPHSKGVFYISLVSVRWLRTSRGRSKDCVLCIYVWRQLTRQWMVQQSESVQSFVEGAGGQQFSHSGHSV